MAKPEQTLAEFAASVGYSPDDIKLYYPWLFDINGRFLGPGHERGDEMIDPQTGEIVPIPAGTVVPPLPPPSGAIPGPATGSDVQVQAQHEQDVQTVHEELQTAQTDEERLRAKLQSAGVSQEGISSVLADPNMVSALLGPGGQLAILGLAQQFPVQSTVTPYSQAEQQLGFDKTQPPPAALPSPFLVGPPGQEVPKPIPPELTRDYEVNHSSGGIRFSNGVIADPTSGQVFFPVNSDAPGSPGWQNEIRTQWGTRQITDWRKRLVAMGYLPTGAEKVKGFDQSFLDALSKYHQLRYLNFGRTTPLDLTATQAAKPEVVVPDAVFIRQNVRQEYQRVFNKDPSDQQLQEWTGFVQQLATHLQRDKGYSPDRAAAVAGERAIESIDTSPDARYLRKTDQENTDLHDAIVGAVQTTRSLMG